MKQAEFKDLLDTFERWVLIPLKEDVQNKTRSHFNIFIVLSVAIDNMANIRYAGEIRKTFCHRNIVGRRYRKFVQKYMPKYKKHSQLLYEGFRNELVHSFQSRGIDIRDDDPSFSKHLTLVENGNLCLHSVRLLEDVLQAFELLKEQLIGQNRNPDAVKSLEQSNYKKWWRTPANSAQ